MTSTPRTPAPERPAPPVPPPPLETPPPDPSPSPPGEEYHTPTPSLGDASPREPSPRDEDGSAHDAAAIAKSPQLSPMRFPSPKRLLTPGSPPDDNGQEGRVATTASPAGHARPQLRLATGLVRTPSHGSQAAKSPSPSPSPPAPLTPAPPAKYPSPSPSPPSPLTPAPAAKSPFPSPPSPQTPAATAKSPSPSPPSPQTPAPAVKSPSPSPPSPLTLAPAPTVNSNKSGQSTPRRPDAWKPPPPPPLASPTTMAQFDPAEEAVTSPLRIGKARLDQQRRTAAENGGAAASAVPPDVAAVAKVGERRSLSVALRLATAVLSLAAFSVMVSARTTGWAGDYYGRHEQYRFIFRSMSSYYFSLFLDQVLAYLLMSASSAAASRNDLWVSRFGTDPFNRKINSAVWLSFIAFLTLAANALISTANLFSMA